MCADDVALLDTAVHWQLQRRFEVAVDAPLTASCLCCVAGGGSPSALVLSGQHSDKLQQLRGSLQGQGGGACKVEVEAADATDPKQASAEPSWHSWNSCLTKL
jgi:hypothetical protein